MSVTASFNYILTPMLADLNLTNDQVSTALAIPSIAAILVVFVAGLLGDRLGQRKILRIAVAFFVVGSLAIAVANGEMLLSVGLLLEGIGATVMSITALGLLGSRIEGEGSGPRHSRPSEWSARSSTCSCRWSPGPSSAITVGDWCRSSGWPPGSSASSRS
jgi:MFS family permease